ncbi:MAG: hypothetical protein IT373_33845 [Polyangiaceae bacterium]|nr:hypothetical protein [Polyangiaceae bacterium]
MSTTDREVGAPRELARRARLRERALALGAGWASTSREEFLQQRRAVAGGWPGTLSEARLRVRWYFDTTSGARQLAPLSRDELEWAARATYASAREAWLAFAEPETDVGAP